MARRSRSRTGGPLVDGPSTAQVLPRTHEDVLLDLGDVELSRRLAAALDVDFRPATSRAVPGVRRTVARQLFSPAKQVLIRPRGAREDWRALRRLQFAAPYRL